MFKTEKKRTEPEPAVQKHPSSAPETVQRMPARSLYSPLEAAGSVSESITPLENHTGIPAPMKSYFELSSGLSFDDVRVHYHSAKPARFQALAYTQGNQVYLGPNQEQHLPHELGHIIQQKMGRVKPTKSLEGIPLNDDPKLEQEADYIG